MSPPGRPKGESLSAEREGSRVSGFSAEWLKLREPYDLRARNAAVLDAVFNLLAGQPSVTLVDLACGTGSTFRALSPRIGARQTWRLVDNDLSLLARVSPSSPPGINVTNNALTYTFNGTGRISCRPASSNGSPWRGRS